MVSRSWYYLTLTLLLLVVATITPAMAGPGGVAFGGQPGGEMVAAEHALIQGSGVGNGGWPPVVATLLLTVGLAGLAIELFTVGFGVAGAVGLVALGLYFYGSWMAGFSTWHTVLLFGLGLVLLMVEVLLIPGFGVAGVAGLVALVASVFLASPDPQQAVVSLVVAFLVTAALLALSFRYLPTRRVWQQLILNTSEKSEGGYIAQKEDRTGLLGATGIALTPLRPAGTAQFDGRRVDVVSEGGFVPRGCQVVVIEVEGPRVVVREGPGEA